MALQRDIKISNIFTQREFIKAQLKKLDGVTDGDPSYSYTGYIYPENLKYFEEEGCTIIQVNSDMAKAVTKGKNIYCFMPKDDIVLTEEELQRAEEAAREKRKEEQMVDEAAGDILESILGMGSARRRPVAGFGGMSGLF